MRRVSGAITAVAIAALAAPAGAAEISHVASSGDEGNPFDIEFSLRWDRSQERAEISREVNAAGSVVEGDEMRFVRTRNAMVPRVAVGLYKDVEIHFALPYVLGDDRSLRYGLVGGVPSGGVPPFDRSTIETNGIDPQGQACTDQNPDIGGAQCPLFRVPQTVYHGGRAGDLEAGLAWAIFNDRKDDTKPTWVVGLDATFPTAA
jgi:hypothetical protein